VLCLRSAAGEQLLDLLPEEAHDPDDRDDHEGHDDQVLRQAR